MEDGIRDYLPENVLHLVVAPPCDRLSGSRLLDKGIVIQRSQHARQGGERIEDFAMLGYERANGVFQPTPKNAR
jgi:hypothetical protein